MKKIVRVSLLLISLTVSIAASAQQVDSSTTLQKILKLQNQQIKLQKELLQSQDQTHELQTAFINQAQKEKVAKQFHWVVPRSDPTKFADRVNAGIEGGPSITICRAHYQDSGVHPGMLTAKGCLITFAGKAYTEDQYQILVGPGKPIWQQKERFFQASINNQPFYPPINHPVILFGGRVSNSGDISSSMGIVPVTAGFESSEPQGPLYICRAIVGNQVHVGKVVANHCNIAVAGGEQLVDNYQVLFAK